MGKKIKVKLIILCSVFLLTCGFVYKKQDAVQLSKAPLKQYLENVAGYKLVSYVPLAEDASDMLDLDDYIFVDYDGPDGKVNLYVGYYYTANKAYAAHSPLICYPSQGWEIDEKTSGRTFDTGEYQINYDEIITSLGSSRELVVFWYQAHHSTNTQIFRNKIDMGYNKFMDNGEQHGFVRISVPLEDGDYNRAKQSIMNFIDAFYPRFIEFVEADNSQASH